MSRDLQREDLLDFLLALAEELDSLADEPPVIVSQEVWDTIMEDDD